MKKNLSPKKKSLNSVRKEIQRIHLIFIMLITVLLSVGGSYININAETNSFDENLLNTSKMISRLYSFSENYSQPQLTDYFNSVCNDLNEIDVISIVDSKNLRIYHTNNDLIGSMYDGKVPDFQNGRKDFHVENETGPSGPQRRTYSAIYDESGKYCGFIMTIMLETSIRSVTFRTVILFAIVTAAAILIEILISGILSRRLKQKLHGYEPDAFSSMFTVRDDILQSLNEGIVAVDSRNNIQFMNEAARKILFGDRLNSDNDKIHGIEEKVFADKFLRKTLDSAEASFGLSERMGGGAEVLVDCIPVKKEENLEGAFAILHDRTEYIKLMEDLSGTKYLVDSMRANNHDFTNKLHVILGLIQIGEYEKAVSYIENISIIQREMLSRVMHSVDNPSFAALLIGKIARASECNIKFILKEGSVYKNSDLRFPPEALVTIAGNLIDNAIDAMNMMPAVDGNLNRSLELVFGVYTKPGELLISVKDNGCGIPLEVGEKIFDNGFSTKGQGRGIGLHHCRRLIESLDGKISFESSPGIGTVFTVNFKKKNF